MRTLNHQVDTGHKTQDTYPLPNPCLPAGRLHPFWGREGWGNFVSCVLCLVSCVLYLTSRPCFAADSLKIIAPIPSPEGRFKKPIIVPQPGAIPLPYTKDSLMVGSDGKLKFIATDSFGNAVLTDTATWEEVNHVVYPANTASDPNLYWGIGTQNPPMKLSIIGNGRLLVTAPYLNPAVHPPACAQGAGTRLLIYPNLGVFRAGRVDGTQWNEANLGTNSAAFGYNNTAAGQNSFVTGSQNSIQSSGTNSAVLGGVNAVLSGANSVIAGGDDNHSSGDFNFVGGGQKAQNNGPEAVVLGGTNHTILGNGNDSVILAFSTATSL